MTDEHSQDKIWELEDSIRELEQKLDEMKSQLLERIMYLEKEIDNVRDDCKYGKDYD